MIETPQETRGNGRYARHTPVFEKYSVSIPGRATGENYSRLFKSRDSVCAGGPRIQRVFAVGAVDHTLSRELPVSMSTLECRAHRRSDDWFFLPFFESGRSFPNLRGKAVPKVIFDIQECSALPQIGATREGGWGGIVAVFRMNLLGC